MTEPIPSDRSVLTDPAPTSPAPRSTWPLVAVGAFTLAVLTLALVAWIDLHDDVWRAGNCGASFNASRATRRLVSLSGAGAMAGLALSGLWLSVRPQDRRARVVFWGAIVLAWLAMVGIALIGGVDIRGYCGNAL